jgi:hypothetical protein
MRAARGWPGRKGVRPLSLLSRSVSALALAEPGGLASWRQLMGTPSILRSEARTQTSNCVATCPVVSTPVPERLVFSIGRGEDEGSIHDMGVRDG